jgi:hypothetical protein
MRDRAPRGTCDGIGRYGLTPGLADPGGLDGHRGLSLIIKYLSWPDKRGGQRTVSIYPYLSREDDDEQHTHHGSDAPKWQLERGLE